MTIERHTVIAFGRNLSMAPQTDEFKLRDAVEVDLNYAEPGKYFTDEIIGKSDPSTRTTRLGPTPSKEPSRNRRIGVFATIHDQNWLGDHIDKARGLVDPANAIVESMRNGIYRARDLYIMQGLVGSAREGETGETTVAFPSGNVLSASGKLTIAKLRSARKALENGKVPGDKIWVGAQSDLDWLFTTTEVNSIDYNAVRALQQGAVNEYHGFKFIWFADDELPLVGGKRRNIAFKKRGNMYKSRAIVGGENANIWQRFDYQGNWEAYIAIDHGFLRRHDEAVFAHDCDDT